MDQSSHCQEGTRHKEIKSLRLFNNYSFVLKHKYLPPKGKRQKTVNEVTVPKGWEFSSLSSSNQQRQRVNLCLILAIDHHQGLGLSSHSHMGYMYVDRWRQAGASACSDPEIREPDVGTGTSALVQQHLWALTHLSAAARRVLAHRRVLHRQRDCWIW